MKESILSRLQVNNTSTKCITVWVTTPLFICYFDIGNYFISCSYSEITNVVSKTESQLRCWSASRLKYENETSEASIQIFVEMSWSMLLWVATFWRYKIFRDHSIYGREYSNYGNLMGKQRLSKTLFFLTLLCMQFSVTLVKQRGRTLALKMWFEQDDSIPPPYQFKREDMRLNLHCEFVDWI